MKRKFPNLCSPIQIGEITLKNRMSCAPMAFPEITPEGYLNKEAEAFYELRAQGGAASVAVSEAIVHMSTGKSHGRQINLQDPQVLPGLTNTARALKRHGAAATIELSHGGKYSAVDTTSDKKNVRYGPISEVLKNGAIVQEMPKEVIREIVESFGKGAALCKKAGFDIIMVHGGHGWLLQQFLSPVNNRKDEYGGSLENRARFACEVLDCIKAAVGPKFPIEYRMSAVEGTDQGYDLDEAIEFIKLIENKIDLLHVSAGIHQICWDITHPSMFSEPGCNVKYAAEIKKHVKVPVAVVGALNDPQMMEEIIASGQADIVVMGRALLVDPFLPKKVMLGKDEEIVHCCRCLSCYAERHQTGTRICALNPITGRELENKYALPAPVKKKVLVAGGGPGGMETAITAARRGHEVILCEKSGSLGGALRSERHIPFKKNLFAFIGSKELQMKQAGVEVRLNTEVTRKYVEQEAPDVLVVAIGAEPIIPPIEGIENPKVVVANNMFEDESKIGQKVVVLGGGLVGCEAAVYLAQTGKDVTVVEMLEDVAVDANVRYRPILLNLLRKLAKIETGLRGIRVTDEGLVCADKTGTEKLLLADTIICAVGQRPLREVVNELLDAAPEVVQVGDCVKPQRVFEAVFRGYHAGLDI